MRGGKRIICRLFQSFGQIQEEKRFMGKVQKIGYSSKTKQEKGKGREN